MRIHLTRRSLRWAAVFVAATMLLTGCGFHGLYGMSLPDAVLKKLYHANALRLTPGLARVGFTD